eukprot:1640152-Lingulodinium_polyedra.AAC.1
MVKEYFRKTWSMRSRRGWTLSRITWHKEGDISEEWERGWERPNPTEAEEEQVPATLGVFLRHDAGDDEVPQTPLPPAEQPASQDVNATTGAITEQNEAVTEAATQAGSAR